MKIFTLSNRFYDQDLSIEDAQAIKDDVSLEDEHIGKSMKSRISIYTICFMNKP